MGRYSVQNQRNIYRAVIIVWFVLFAVMMSWIIAQDLQRAKTRFSENANLHYQQSSDRVHVIETVLEGFAVMVSVTNDPGRERIRTYAKKMLERYPHIFMFEIVEKVPHNLIKLFTEHYRNNAYPDFEVKGFSYGADRDWQPLKAVPYHMPIVFMEPFPEKSRNVMGLDLSSNEFFMRALELSELLNSSISSDPFKLIEGDLAYVIHRPIPSNDNGPESFSTEYGAEGEFAVLVIRADSLLDREHHPLPGMRELLYKAEYNETDPRGHLHLHAAPATSWLESKIFPRLQVTMMLDSTSQPFALLVEHQLGWGIISWEKLGIALLIALFTFWVMLVYARLYLHHEMARAERYLQIARAIIVGLDRDGNVNLINQRGCEILGYSEKEILGRNWFKTVLPYESRDAVFRVFQKIVAGEAGLIEKYENEILTKNGEVRYIDWNNSVETDAKGAIVGTLSSGQDVTERKRAEEDLQRYHQEMAHVMRLGTMGEMATGLAHELNQPLAALVSYCGTAAAFVNSLPSPPRQLGDILARATEQAHRAADIIRHLREFVRKEDNSKEAFDLDQVINGVITFLKWEVQKSGIRVEFLAGGQSHKVMANKIQIEQVLINLMRNSIEAMEQAQTIEGRIVIQTRLLANDKIQVSVTDNGPGIDASMADKIFDQFQTSKKGGMGIGLSFSRSIIEIHGGNLWLDKTHQNGAAFSFVLPVVSNCIPE
jgi:PAS domain S-box-containing protein